MWVIASNYRVVFSEDIRDASGAAPAAAAGVLSRVDTQTTEIEETGSEVPRPENRSNVTVEASYFVGLREQCRAV